MLTVLVKMRTSASSARMECILPSTSHKEMCPTGGKAEKPWREHIIPSCNRRYTNTRLQFDSQNWIYIIVLVRWVLLLRSCSLGWAPRTWNDLHDQSKSDDIGVSYQYWIRFLVQFTSPLSKVRCNLCSYFRINFLHAMIMWTNPSDTLCWERYLLQSQISHSTFQT
jgi:hypothetical protein